MIDNRIELVRDGAPKVLITWHMPDGAGAFHRLAFQFAEDVDEATRREVVEVAQRPLKIVEKGYKLAQCGSSDHFSALPRPLGRLGFRTRVIRSAQERHPLHDRPVEGV